MTSSNAPWKHIDVSSLPDISKSEVEFHGTSFFRSRVPSPRLPLPIDILQIHKNRENAVVKFEDLNLAVKYGPPRCVRLEEAQTMIAIKQAFANHEVPVPEVYGWKRYGDTTFIYMSLVPGETLREGWPSLTEDEKKTIRDDLKRVIGSLRRLRQDPADQFIGSINKGAIQDRLFQPGYDTGPFPSIKSFNDWFQTAALRQPPGSKPVSPAREPWREYLSDEGQIYFTHGDLTLGNIIIDGKPGSKRVVGIIDWEQAGWYPGYWEYCKLLFAVPDHHEWRNAGWVDTVMETYKDEFLAFAEYSLWRGP